MLGPESPGDKVRGYFDSADGDIRYVFAPYIQEETLEKILPVSNTDTIIVTNWNTENLVAGVSDPEVFKFCQEREYTLKLHSRLHAKVYSWDLDDAIVGSANITKPGMGIGRKTNIEVLIGPAPLPSGTELLLRRTESEASLVTEKDYEAAIDAIDSVDVEPPEYDEIEYGVGPEYLVSQLPKTKNPSKLINILASDVNTTLEDVYPEIRRCLIHDIATYSLEKYIGLPRTEVEVGLRKEFESHRFIANIINKMDPCLYFGEMKAVVQEECIDVPTPTRRELTENIQVLYDWFPKVAPQRFSHDIPGRHSERLCDKSKMGD